MSLRPVTTYVAACIIFMFLVYIISLVAALRVELQSVLVPPSHYPELHVLLQSCSQRRESFRVQAVREVVQAVIHSLHTPADPLGHATLSVPVLWQALPPEVRHEEAHLHPHR